MNRVRRKTKLKNGKNIVQNNGADNSNAKISITILIA